MAKKISFKLFNLVATLAIVLAGIFGLSACSNWPWGEETPSSDSRYDSLGRLRIASVGVNYNAPNKADGRVDEKTGSFDWDLAYYFDVGKNFTYTNNGAKNNYYGELDSGSTDAFRLLTNGYKFLEAGQTYYYTRGSEAYTYNVSTTGWYGVELVENTVVTTPLPESEKDKTQDYLTKMIGRGSAIAQGTTLSDQRLLKAQVVLNGSDKNHHPVFVFSSYIVSVSGVNYYIKIEANSNNLVIDYANPNQLFSLKGGTTLASTFVVKYKEYGVDNANWKTVGEGDTYTLAKIENIPDSTYHKDHFVIRFFPKLEKGASTRYVQVKASTTEALTNEANGDRGTSALSGITTFKVYPVVFDIKVFGSTFDYNTLSYDHTKYYFAYDATGSATEKGSASSELAGYFPEGKQVVVTRSFDKNGNYAFQRWTYGNEAENSYVMNLGNDHMPNKHGGYEFMTTYSGDNQISCLSAYTRTKGAYEIAVTNSGANKIIDNADHSNIAKEVLSTDGNIEKSSLTVVACSSTASNIFHANMAKIKNFVMSGNFVDTEILTEEDSLNNAQLEDVTIFVYKTGADTTADGQPNPICVIESSNGQITFIQDNREAFSSTAYDYTKINGTYSNAAFNISGLSWDCYLLFDKSSTQKNSYSFYSTSSTMIKKDADNDKSVRILQLKRAANYSEIQNILTDTTQNTIMGTNQPAAEKVNVNLYVYRGGSAVDLEPTNNQVPYQVISTTTQEADENGYTTSQIVVALQLPSNYTLTSYTVETLNNIGQVFYTSGSESNNYILCNVSYDKTNQTQIKKYYYVTTSAISSGVTTNNARSYLFYNNEFYQFVKRESDATNYFFYYDLISNNEVLKTIKLAENKTNESEKSYTLFTYAQITIGSDSSYDAQYVQDETTSDDTITISGHIAYKGTDYYYARMTGSDIAVVATAYAVNDAAGNQLEIELKDNDGKLGSHPMYVYYDVTTYNPTPGDIRYYYTAPIARRVVQLVTEGTDNHITTKISTQVFVDAFNNDIINNTQLVALGSQLIDEASRTDGSGNVAYKSFVAAMGGTAAVIADCYYYYKPVGTYTNGAWQSTNLLISQYVSTDATMNEIKDATIFYLGDEIYKGQVSKTVDSYSYQMRGTYLDATDKNLYDVLFSYNHETNKYIIDEHEYELSTSRKDNFVLYSPVSNENGNYAFETYSYTNFGDENFDPNYIMPNISAATHISDNNYYFTQRKAYGQTTTNTNKFAMIYQFMIYTTNPILGGATINVDIYYDGTNFYYYDTTELENRIISTTDESGNSKNYDIIKKLNITDNKVILPVSIDGTVYNLPIIVKDDTKYKTNYEASSNDVLFNVYCNTRYYKFDESQTALINPTMLQFEYYSALGEYHTEFTANKILWTSITMSFTENEYSYHVVGGEHAGEVLREERKNVIIETSKSSVVRKAVPYGNLIQNVYLIGKTVLIKDGYVDYPSFDTLIETDVKSVLRDQKSYYEVDYTTKKSVIQAFPGVTLLSGAPYVNPVFHFEIFHRAGEQTELNLSVEIVDAYYVEVMTNAITSTENPLLYDFSTVSFKDTITNLTQNDYIDRMYYVVFADNLDTVIAYTISGDIVTPYLSGTPLTIQNIGLNDNDEWVYSSSDISETGKYITNLYYEISQAEAEQEDPSIIKLINGKYYKPLSTKELVIWSSSAIALEDIPIFDIHGYKFNDDGLIVLSSDGKENEICEKVDDLFINGTGSTVDSYDYSEVLIGGTTFAYRVDAEALEKDKATLQAYTWGSAINIANTYDAAKAYFLCGKEGVVLVASPVVSIPLDGEEIIYRFKRWTVYSRYNSEILYLNNEILGSDPDIYNAIMRFTSNQAGYFIFMPIYERVYAVNVATAIYDGADNLGGSVSVSYEYNSYTDTGAAVDLSLSKYDNAADPDHKEARDIYFIEYYKTTVNDKEEYRYSDVTIDTKLYFTGNYEHHTLDVMDNDGNIITYQSPEFKPITIFKAGEDLYFQVDEGTNNLKYVRKITSYVEGQPGLIDVKTQNTQYLFNYQYTNGHQQEFYSYNTYFGDDVLKGYQDTKLEDLLSYAYTVQYFADGKINSSAASSKIVYFNENDKQFYALNNDEIIKTNILNEIQTSSIAEVFAHHGEAFAVAKNNRFNAIAKTTNSIGNGDGTFTSPDGILYSGELYSYIRYKVDENGNPIKFAVDSDGKFITDDNDKFIIDDNGDYMEEEIVYPSIQFKSSYYDRDTSIVISALPSSGYRLYGWYLAEYDEITDTWTTSNTQLSELINTTYTDEIRPVAYNQSNGNWYYITSLREGTEGNYIYYRDETKTPAIVSKNILNSLVGKYYYNSDLGHYMPVYQNTETGVWYTDSIMTKKYTGKTDDIIDYAHYFAIYGVTIDDAGGYTHTTYYLGNSVVYQNGQDEYDIKDISTDVPTTIHVAYPKMYRAMKDANMTFKDNQIYVKNLHGNVRVVAKFIENYQTMIFAEDSSEDNLQVVAVYYESPYAQGKGGRTDDKGNVINDMPSEAGISMADFNAHKPTDENDNIYKNPFANGKYQDYHYYNDTILNTASSKTSYLRVATNSNNFYKMTDTEQNEDGTIEYVDIEPKDLILRNFHFDVETEIYVVVRVYFQNQLSIHSLGLNPSYKLVPVLCPTDAFIQSNRGAEPNQRHDYYFYLFKVSFNRDLGLYDTSSSSRYGGASTVPVSHPYDNGNFNPEYLVHINRGKSVVGDVLSGYYTNIYAQMFDFYTENNIKMFDTYTYASNSFKLSQEYIDYIAELLRKYGIEDKEGLLDPNRNYTNLKEFFDALHDNYHVVQTVNYVKANLNTDKYTSAKRFDNEKLTAYNDILAVINSYIIQYRSDDTHTKQINTAGTTNFINLATIPVYTYTTSIQLIDSVDSAGQAEYKDVQHADNQLPRDNVALVDIGVRFDQKLYTRGGYEGYTYVGVGKEEATTGADRYILGSAYDKKFSANASVGLEDMFAEDYALAQNTIMVLGGIVKGNLESHNGIYSIVSNGTTYVFKGWYEQKRLTTDSRVTSSYIWGDMQFMSADLAKPFESTAYADTNIIALFEKVVEVEIPYVNNSLSVNMNSAYDDLGLPINYTITGVKGSFSVTSLLKLDITPSGSYRFGNSVVISDGTTQKELGGAVKFYQGFSSITEPDINITQANLVETVSAEVSVASLVRKFVNATKISIEFAMEEVRLLYIAVDGYLTTQGNAKIHSGYEFALFYNPPQDPTDPNPYDRNKLIKIAETEYKDGNVTINMISGPESKDSANRPITAQMDPENNQRLVVYGYFDKDYSGRFYIGYIKTKTDEDQNLGINAWYVDAFQTSTEAAGIQTYAAYQVTTTEFTLDSAKPGATIPDKFYNNLFKICYYYTKTDSLEGTISNLEMQDKHIYLTNADDEYDAVAGTYNFNDNIIVVEVEDNGKLKLAAGQSLPEGLSKDKSNDLYYLKPYTVSETNAKVDEFNANYFQNNLDNPTYLLTAEITTANALSVAYATVDTLEGYHGTEYPTFSENAHTAYITKDHQGSIAWTGFIYDDDIAETAKANGSSYFVDYEDEKPYRPFEYTFTTDTTITLSNNLAFYYNSTDDTYYKFIGWFSVATDEDSNPISYKMVSNSLTYTTRSGGLYIAIFAKITRVNLSVETRDGADNLVDGSPIDGIINAISDYPIAYSNGTGVATFDIECYGATTYQNPEDLSTFGQEFAYAIIGSTIKVVATADNGYLVVGLKANGINIMPNDQKNQQIVTTIPSYQVKDEVTDIVATFARGVTVKVKHIYYDGIDMTSVAQDFVPYDSKFMVTVDGEQSISNNESRTFTFVAGSEIIIIATNSDKLGIIGFYIDNQKYEVYEYSVINIGVKVYGQYKINYTITNDITIEARYTNFVDTKAKAYVANTNGGKGEELDVANPYAYITYNGFYTNNVISTNDSGKTKIDGDLDELLSGMTVSLSTELDSRKSNLYAFVHWNYATNTSATSLALTEFINVNNQALCNMSVDDLIGLNSNNDTYNQIEYQFYAIYKQAYVITIEKQISSINDQDKDFYHGAYTSGNLDITQFDSEFITMLDTKVEYYDVYGNKKTATLGIETSIQIVCQRGKDLTIDHNFAKSVEDRYGYKVSCEKLTKTEESGNGINNSITYGITDSDTITFIAYAARTITLIRQVNNEPNTEDCLRLVASPKDGSASFTIGRNESTATKTKIDIKADVTITATTNKHSVTNLKAYKFAGFYINGQYYGRSNFQAGDTSINLLSIKYITDPADDAQQSVPYESLCYTRESNMTIVALWYAAAEITTYVSLDDHQIYGSANHQGDTDYFGANNDGWSNLLVMTMYGNRLTWLNEDKDHQEAVIYTDETHHDPDPSFVGTYNSNLQSYRTTSGYTELVQAGHTYREQEGTAYGVLGSKNLALLASTESGYQFVGFYFVDVTGSTKDFDATYLINQNKVACQVTNESNTFFGDALAAIIDNETTNRQIVAGHSYIVIARYMTAYTITTQTTISKQETSDLPDTDIIMMLVEQTEDSDSYAIIDYEQLGVNGAQARNFRDSSRNYVYYLPRYTNEFNRDDIGYNDNIEYTNGCYIALNYPERLTNKAKLNPDIKYVFDGFYINGIKLDNSVVLGLKDVAGQEGQYWILDLSSFITKASTEPAYTIFDNIVIEARYVELAEFVVRIGMNNTNDIERVSNSALLDSDVAIAITIYNDHYDAYNKTITLSARNDSDAIYSTTEHREDLNFNTYWNKDNNSLYVKLLLPIGTKITTTISGAEDDTHHTIKVGNFLYDGWYVYANQSIATSRTVINYTRTCEFTISEDTDIVAQFYDTHESYTTDTQYAFRFVGETFYDINDNDDGILYVSEQNFNNQFATALKELALGTAYNNAIESTYFNDIYFDSRHSHKISQIQLSAATQDAYNNPILAYTNPNGQNGKYLVFTITKDGKSHNYLFTGWYQELKGGTKNKYLFITNNFGLDYTGATKPHQLENAINLCAEFVEIVDITLNQTTANTLLINHIDTAYNYFVDNSALYSFNSDGTAGVDVADILHAESDRNLNYHITTLYNSTYKYKYQVLQGYHGKLGSKDDAAQYDYNMFLPYDTYDTHPEKPTLDTTIIIKTEVEESEKQHTASTIFAHEYHIDDYIEGTTIVKNKYTYSVTQKGVVTAIYPFDPTKSQQINVEMYVLALRSKKLVNPSSTSGTRTSIGDKHAVSSVQTAISDSKHSNIATADGDYQYLDFDEEDIEQNNKTTNLYAQIFSPLAELTDVIVNISVRLPDGTIITKTLDRNDLGNMAAAMPLPFNDVPLTLGTVISVSIDATGCKNEMLAGISIYITPDNLTWAALSEEQKPQYLLLDSPAQYTDNQYKLNFAYVINDSYQLAGELDPWAHDSLWIKIDYANIFPLSLEENDIAKGSVLIEYVDYTSEETIRDYSKYHVEFNASNNYSTNDIDFNLLLDKETGVFSGYENLFAILSNMIDNYDIKNLADLIQAVNDYDGILTYDNWSAEVVDEINNSIRLVYTYASKQLLNVIITPQYSDLDGARRHYLTGLDLNFKLKTRVDIKTDYLHVAYVTTFATIESYNPNDETNHITETKETYDNPLVYAYDYEFYTEESGNYAIINQLEEFYSYTEIYSNTNYEHTGYMYLSVHLKENNYDYGVQVITDSETEASNTLVIEALFVYKYDAIMGIEIQDYVLGSLNTTTNNMFFVVDGKHDQSKQAYNNADIDDFIIDGQFKQLRTYHYGTPLNASANLSVWDTEAYFTFVEWKVYYVNEDLTDYKPIVKSIDADGSVQVLTYAQTSILYNADFISSVIKAFKDAYDTYGEMIDTDSYAVWSDDIDPNRFVFVATMQEQATEITILYEHSYKIDDEAFGVAVGGDEYYATATPNSNNDAITAHGQTYQYHIYQLETEPYRFVVAYAKSNTNPIVNIKAMLFQTRTNSNIAGTDLLKDPNNTFIRIIMNENPEKPTYASSQYLKLVGFVDDHGLNQARKNSDGKFQNYIVRDGITHSETFNLTTSNLYLIEIMRAVYGTIIEGPSEAESYISINAYGVGSRSSTAYNTDTSVTIGTYSIISKLIEEGTIVQISTNNRGALAYATPARDMSYRGLAISSSIMASDYLAKLLSYVEEYNAEHPGAEIDSAATFNFLKQIWFEALGYEPSMLPGVDEDWSGLDDLSPEKIPELVGIYQTLASYSNYSLSDSSTAYTFIANSHTSFIADHIGMFGYHRDYISTVFGADKTSEFKYANTNGTKETQSNKVYAGNNFGIVITSKENVVEYNITKDYDTEGVIVVPKYIDPEQLKQDGIIDYSDENPYVTFVYNGKTIGAEVVTISENEKKLLYMSGILPADVLKDSDGYLYFDTNKIYYTPGSVLVAHDADGNSCEATIKDKIIDFTQVNKQVVIGVVNEKVVTMTMLKANKYMNMTRANGVASALYEEFIKNNIPDNYTLKDEFSFIYGLLGSMTPSPTNIIAEIGTDNFVNLDNATTLTFKKGSKVNLYAEADDKNIFYGFLVISETTKTSIDNFYTGAQNLRNNYSTWTMKLLTNYGTQTMEIMGQAAKSYHYATNISIDGNVEILALYQPKVNLVHIQKVTYDEITENIDDCFDPKEDDESTTQGKVKAENLLIDTNTEFLDLTIVANGYCEYKGAASFGEYIGAMYYENSTMLADDSDTIKNAEENIETAVANHDESSYYQEADAEVDGFYYGFLNSNQLFIKSYSTKNADGHFTRNTNTISTLKLYWPEKANGDATIYLYFNPFYYDMNITLVEYETGREMNPDGSDANEHSYIAYSEKVRTAENWKNPTAKQELTKEQWINILGRSISDQQWAQFFGKNEGDDNIPSMMTVGKYFGIADNDPYIYTWYDDNNNLLAYPVKVNADMIVKKDYQNQEMDKLYLKRDKDQHGTQLLKTQYVQSDMEEQAYTVEYNDFQERYYDHKISSVYDYVIQTASTIDKGNEYGLRENLFSITIDGKILDSKEFKIDPYYINSAQSGNSFKYKLANINLTELVTADVLLEFNSNSPDPTIQIKLKVFADKNTGLPIIDISDAKIKDITEAQIKQAQNLETDEANDKVYNESLRKVVKYTVVGVEHDIVKYMVDEEEKTIEGYSQYVFDNSPNSYAVEMPQTKRKLNHTLNSNLFQNAFIATTEGYFIYDKVAYPKTEVNVQIAFERSSKIAEARLIIESGENSQSAIDLTKPGSSAIQISNEVRDYVNQNGDWGAKDQYTNSDNQQRISSDSYYDRNATNLSRALSYNNNYLLYRAAVDQYIKYIYKDYGQDGYDTDNWNYHKLAINDSTRNLYFNLVDTYDLYVVKNLQEYIYALGDIGNNYQSKKSKVAELITELLSFNPASNISLTPYGKSVDSTSESDNGVHSQIAKRKQDYVAGLPQTGSIFDYINTSKDTYITLLNTHGYESLAYRLKYNCEDLTFNRLNVFANFNKGANKDGKFIDQNYFGNLISFGDGVITCSKLTEHFTMHKVAYDLFDNVWKEEESGYVFLDHTKSDWASYANQQSNARAYSTHYDNDYINEIASLSKPIVNSAQQIINWCSGIINRGKKYMNTYSIVSHAGFSAIPQDYIDPDITAFTSNTIISTYKTTTLPEDFEDRLRTTNMDVVHVNAIREILTGAIIVVGVTVAAVASYFTGGVSLGAMFAIIGAGVAVGGTVIAIGVNDLLSGGTAYVNDRLFGFIDQLDFTFNTN